MKFLQAQVQTLLAFALISATMLSAGVATAQQANLVLRGFGPSEWQENEVEHTQTPGISRYWDGTSFADTECEGCILIVGAIFNYPMSEAPGVDGRELFVPYEIWISTEQFGSSSTDPLYGAIGAYLADQVRDDTEFRVRLGIGEATDAAPSSYFPDDYFAVPARQGTIGRLKGRY